MKPSSSPKSSPARPIRSIWGATVARIHVPELGVHPNLRRDLAESVAAEELVARAGLRPLELVLAQTAAEEQVLGVEALSGCNRGETYREKRANDYANYL